MKVDLLNGKLNKTYFTLLTSAIASTIVSTIYSTVDIICVGHYAGPEGAAAIVCINPLWALIFAFGFLCGVGGAVMMANRRGANDNHAANEYYTIATVMSLIFSTLLVAVYSLFTEPILVMLGAEGEVLRLGVQYMQGMIFSIPTFTVCACLSTFMRSDGEALIPTIATITGGIINMLLDVLLVFVFDMGVKGAGLATGIGQTVAFSIILFYFFTKKCTLKFTKPHKTTPIVIKIVTVGFAAFIIDLTSGVTTAVHNMIITNNLTASHLAVYSTASMMIIMFNSLFSGIGTAMQPMVAIGFGAGDTKRVKGVVRLSFLTAIAMGFLFLSLCELFPGTLLRVYMDVTDEVMDVGPRIIRLYTLALPITGICLVCNYYFQATLHRGASVLISLLRGLIFPILLVLTIPLLMGYDYIWLGVPFGEILTCIIAILIILPMLKSLTNKKAAQLK